MSIDVKLSTITVNDVIYDVDCRDGTFPVARSYQLNDTTTGDPIEGIEAEIHYDEHSFSPREDYDNFGVLVSIGNPDYTWGDEQWDERFRGTKECPRCESSGDDPERFFITRGQFAGDRVGSGSEQAMNVEAERDPDLFVYAETCSLCEGEGEIETTLEEYLRINYDASVVIGVNFANYGSNPSSCAVTKLDNDDSDNGVIYATKAKIKEEFGDEDIDAPLNDHTKRMWGDNPPTTRREAIIRLLEGEVETYSQYLEGDVYYYRVEDEESSYDDGCGGMYGYEYAEEELYRSLESAIKKRQAETFERAEMAARDIITIKE